MTGQNKLSIAFVSDTAYPFFKGGKEKRIHEITKRLAANGHAVTLYTMQWWKGPKEIVQDGVILKAISPRYSIYSGKRRSIKEAVLFGLHCLKLIRATFDVIEVDHMPHLVLFPLKIVCLLKGKKLIATWHEVWGREYWKEYLGGGLKAWLAYAVEAASVHLPDLVISVSEHTTKKLGGILGRTKNVTLVSNGLDMTEFLSGTEAEKGADVIFAGRLLSHKNVDLLLRAAREVMRDGNEGLAVWIIGDGPAKPSLEVLAQELDIQANVRFLGFLEKEEELYGIMKASKMLVLPSTREGFGLVAIEANACGIPFITVDHDQNATRDLISQGENGLLVKPDAKEIAEGIKTLLREKKPAAFYRKFADRYDWDNAAAKILKIYYAS